MNSEYNPFRPPETLPEEIQVELDTSWFKTYFLELATVLFWFGFFLTVTGTVISSSSSGTTWWFSVAAVFCSFGLLNSRINLRLSAITVILVCGYFIYTA